MNKTNKISNESDEEILQKVKEYLKKHFDI